MLFSLPLSDPGLHSFESFRAIDHSDGLSSFQSCVPFVSPRLPVLLNPYRFMSWTKIISYLSLQIFGEQERIDVFVKSVFLTQK